MKFMHNEIGPIEITFRKNTSKISARWKNGVAVFIFPESIDRREIPDYVNRMASAVIARRHDVTFSENQVIEVPGFTFLISRQSHQPRNVWGTVKDRKAYIEVGTLLDFDNLNVKQSISRIMSNIAHDIAAEILLPRAKEVAATIGASPRSWAIMNGFKTLGKCSSRGDIHISYMCLFLPLELRDYIVCHELAHLSEMSHSPRFHAICDHYCDGKEKELIRKLNHFPWQILRR
ncbi:MAG: M48 family metallopeptidase [Lachnospiraceae bacterium]|nr:M48 family metallopeptidase [Lachnospiraceae bacterium]